MYIGRLAPLWPFIGICVEVIVLVVIIAVYEKRRSKQLAEEARREEAQRLYVRPSLLLLCIKMKKCIASSYTMIRIRHTCNALINYLKVKRLKAVL